MSDQIFVKIQLLEQDIDRLAIFVNGSITAQMETDKGKKIDSIAKIEYEYKFNILEVRGDINDIKRQIEALKLNASQGRIGYTTLELLKDDHTRPAHTVAEVLNDGENNGVYVYDGENWIKGEDRVSDLYNQVLIIRSKLQTLVPTASRVGDVYGFNAQGGENLLEIISNDGKRTWLEIGPDGLPTDISIKAIGQKVGASFENAVPQSNLMFAITSLEGVVTELSLDGKGQLPPFVVNRLRKLIDPVQEVSPQNELMFTITDKIGNCTELSLNHRGELADFVVQRLKQAINPTNRVQVGFIGSSSMELMHKWIPTYFGDYTTLLLGDSGARFDSIAVRGGMPATIKFPSENIITGYNPIIASWEVDAGMKPFNVTLDNGIQGAISYSASAYRMHCKDPAVITTEEEIDFSNDHGLFDFVFINSGKNNLKSTAGLGVEIYNKTVALTKYYRSIGVEYVVMDHFVNQNSNTATKENVLECNRLLKLRYGVRFLSVFDMIQSDEMWAFTGLTKTQQDIDCIAKGEIPPSFQQNTSHLNHTANQFIVFKMLEKYKELTNDSNN